jgi:iron-sulfur cluster assembly protein
VGSVLTLTPTAAEVVRTLVEQSPAPASGGLRIAAGEETGEGVPLELSIVNEPDPADETIEQEGATVYLDPSAAELLDDKLLDAQVGEDRVTFTLREDDGDGDGDAPFTPNGNGHASHNGDGPH